MVHVPAHPTASGVQPVLPYHSTSTSGERVPGKMPPKRKRPEEANPDGARATRSSARIKEASQELSQQSESTQDEVSVPKKAKRGGTKTAAKRGRGSGMVQGIEEARTDGSLDQAPSASANKPAVAPTKTSGSEPYSLSLAATLFRQYADPDKPTVIGPEGFERLCTDAGILLEGALPLILAWQMHASEMAKISKSEWDTAAAELRVANLQTLSLILHELEDLLLLGKPPIEIPPTAPVQAKRKMNTPVSADPYNRARYHRYATDPKRAFNELYLFCFTLAKPPQARNIDMETASAFWSVLLAPQYPIVSDLLEFIREKGTYKGVNKDLWNMTLEFCRTVEPDLSNYETDGAWPTILDDFVAWKNNKDAGKGVPPITADS